jgi:hypothetical protein
MPFKGDMRLGGARDNENTMNGFSAGPDFPAEGTILSTLTNVTYPVEEGGAQGSFTNQGGGETLFASQKCSVNIVADGLGGQYTDWDNATNVQFFQSGEIIEENVRQDDSNLYFDVTMQSYVNGYIIVSVVHDGYGGATESGVTFYNTTAVFYEGEAGVYYDLDGTSYQVGNATRAYSHNGTGGYTYSDNNTVYFYQGYVVGSGSSVINTSIGGNDYAIGSNSYEVHSDGLGAAVYANTQTSYYSYGTFITTYDGYNYYSDGYGGTYSEQVPSYPESGTETGNYSSGTNYIDINGTQYENGTYSGTEYNDGSGGTYWSYSYSYQYYGYEFTYGYYSDGNGGYYS